MIEFRCFTSAIRAMYSRASCIFGRISVKSSTQLAIQHVLVAKKEKIHTKFAHLTQKMLHFTLYEVFTVNIDGVEYTHVPAEATATVATAVAVRHCCAFCIAFPVVKHIFSII